MICNNLTNKSKPIDFFTSHLHTDDMEQNIGIRSNDSLNVNPPIQTPLPKKYKYPFPLWLAIIVLAGVASYFGYQNRILKQQLSQIKQNQNSSVLSLPVATLTPNPTANWEKYIDSLNKFEVHYPNDWILSKNVISKDKYSQVVDVAKTLDSTIYNPDGVHALWIKLIDNPGNNSLEQIIKSGVLDKNYGTLSTKLTDTNTTIPPQFITATINGYEMYQPDHNWPSAFGIKTVFIKNPTNNSFAWLNLEPYDNNNQNLSNIFDQILSTFKFTNATSGIPNSINKIFTAVNQAFGSNITPTKENQFYSLKGFVNQDSWKMDLSSLLTGKSQFTILNNTLNGLLKEDINNSAGGVGQNATGYQNDYIYCFFLQGFNASDYISCVEK